MLVPVFSLTRLTRSEQFTDLIDRLIPQDTKGIHLCPLDLISIAQHRHYPLEPPQGRTTTRIRGYIVPELQPHPALAHPGTQYISREEGQPTKAFGLQV